MKETPAAPKASSKTTKIKIPTSPTKYASAIAKLIDKTSPSKKKALEAENIVTSASKRSATASIVSAAATAMQSDKTTKRSLVKELAKKSFKKSISKIMPLSRATLQRKPHGRVGRPTLSDDNKRVIVEFYNHQENIHIFPNKIRKKTPAQP